MNRHDSLCIGGILLSSFLSIVAPRAQAATLELSPATSVIDVGDQIQFLVYGTGFPDGADGGDFSLAWTPNLAYVGLTIESSPWDVSSVEAPDAASGLVDSVDVFSSVDTPGLGGTQFHIARLTLQATAEGAASVTIGTNLVGWSLGGGSVDHLLGPDAQVDVLPLPEPGSATALGLAFCLLGSLRRARRRTVR